MNPSWPLRVSDPMKPEAMPHTHTAMRTFSVYIHGDARHCRTIEGADFEDAALAFVHDWAPQLDEDGQVSVIVTDQETGREQCLCVDMADDSADPCYAREPLKR